MWFIRKWTNFILSWNLLSWSSTSRVSDLHGSRRVQCHWADKIQERKLSVNEWQTESSEPEEVFSGGRHASRSLAVVRESSAETHTHTHTIWSSEKQHLNQISCELVAAAATVWMALCSSTVTVRIHVKRQHGRLPEELGVFNDLHQSVSLKNWSSRRSSGFNLQLDHRSGGCSSSQPTVQVMKPSETLHVTISL